MKQSDITKLLREHGLPMSEALALSQTITKKEQARIHITRAHDWDYLLEPLTHDIRVKASTMSRWSQDQIRGPVYGPYLDMLRKTKKRIQQARDLNLNGWTIPEIAREKSLRRNGMHWSDWVPDKVHTAFMLAFQTLNSHPDLSRKGKRCIPFTTTMERNASDKRWDNLTVHLLVEIAARGAPGLRADARTQAPLIDAMQEALDIIYTRSNTEVCPVKWEHLLSKDRQEELDIWYQGTINGMRDPAALDAATNDLYDRAEARIQERKDKAHKAYMRRKANAE